MYCIDGVRTLKNCKPTLILESLNKDQKQYAKSKPFGVKLTEVANAFTGAFAPQVNAYALA